MPVIYALASIPLAMLIALILKRLQIGESTTFIALLVLPLGIWGISSGVVSEMTAGGVVLKFKAAAKEDVKTQPLTENMEDFQIIGKAGPSALNGFVKKLMPGKPIALTLQLGRGGYYDPATIVLYLQTLMSVDPELTLVVTDPSDRFVAAADGRSVISLLTSDDPGAARRFSDAIDGTDVAKVLALPGFADASMAETATNGAALKKMDATGRKTLVALDANNKPSGIVKRDAIVAHLLTQLLPDTEQ